MSGTGLNVTIAHITSVNMHNKVGAIIHLSLELGKLRLRKREGLDGLHVARWRLKPQAGDLQA